jgi:hypothetical protein
MFADNVPRPWLNNAQREFIPGAFADILSDGDAGPVPAD